MQVTVSEDTTQILELQKERRVVGDFEYLVGMLYRDDENGLLYVTQKITTQRGFILAWVALFSIDDAKLGATEDRPVHVPDVARMVVEYQRNETLWVLGGTGSVVDLNLSWMALLEELLVALTTVSCPPAVLGLAAYHRFLIQNRSYHLYRVVGLMTLRLLSPDID